MIAGDTFSQQLRIVFCVGDYAKRNWLTVAKIPDSNVLGRSIHLNFAVLKPQNAVAILL
jgi:hypothetical protein